MPEAEDVVSRFASLCMFRFPSPYVQYIHVSRNCPCTCRSARYTHVVRKSTCMPSQMHVKTSTRMSVRMPTHKWHHADADSDTSPCTMQLALCVGMCIHVYSCNRLARHWKALAATVLGSTVGAMRMRRNALATSAQRSHPQRPTVTPLNAFATSNTPTFKTCA